MSAITTAAEAEQAIEQVADLIERLRGLVEQETELVHAGKVRKATALARPKSELAGQLFTAGERLKANAKFLLQTVPARCRRAAPAAGGVPRRTAEEHDRAGDLARSVGEASCAGSRATLCARPRRKFMAPRAAPWRPIQSAVSRSPSAACCNCLLRSRRGDGVRG